MVWDLLSLQHKSVAETEIIKKFFSVEQSAAGA
jgi:hypothetical protein